MYSVNVFVFILFEVKLFYLLLWYLYLRSLFGSMDNHLGIHLFSTDHYVVLDSDVGLFMIRWIVDCHIGFFWIIQSFTRSISQREVSQTLTVISVMPAWSLKPVELCSLDSRDRGAFRRVIIVDGDFAFFLETVIGFVTDQIAVLELG